MPLALATVSGPELPLSGLLAYGGNGVVRASGHVRVGVARLEHDYLVLAAGVGGQPGVGASSVRSRRRARTYRWRWTGPRNHVHQWPMSVCVAYAVRTPAVVGVAHEVVVISQGQPKAAVRVLQPVLPQEWWMKMSFTALAGGDTSSVAALLRETSAAPGARTATAISTASETAVKRETRSLENRLI